MLEFATTILLPSSPSQREAAARRASCLLLLVAALGGPRDISGVSLRKRTGFPATRHCLPRAWRPTLGDNDRAGSKVIKQGSGPRTPEPSSRQTETGAAERKQREFVHGASFGNQFCVAGATLCVLACRFRSKGQHLRVAARASGPPFCVAGSIWCAHVYDCVVFLNRCALRHVAWQAQQFVTWRADIVDFGSRAQAVAWGHVVFRWFWGPPVFPLVSGLWFGSCPAPCRAPRRLGLSCCRPSRLTARPVQRPALLTPRSRPLPQLPCPPLLPRPLLPPLALATHTLRRPRPRQPLPKAKALSSRRARGSCRVSKCWGPSRWCPWEGAGFAHPGFRS